MKLKKAFVIVCLLLSTFLLYTVRTVQASDIEKEEIENIFSAEQDVYSVSHGKEITITFNVKEDLADDEYFVSFEDGNIKTNNEKNEKVKKNDKYSFTLSSENIGADILKIEIESKHYFGDIYIYLYSTENIDYISTKSMNSATREYYEYLVANEMATEEDYNDIVFSAATLPSDNSISTYISYYNSNYIYIRGYVKYTDNATGNIIPAQGVKVVVYDVDLLGIRTELKTIYTNSSGYYYTSFLNDDGFLENGYDIVVKVYFGTEDFNVFDPLFEYSFEFDTYTNAPNGLNLKQNVTFLKPIGNNERNSAMQINQALITGFKYLRYISDDDYFYVEAQYPSVLADAVNSCFYNFVSDVIHLTSALGNSDYLWDTVLHEYGHYVADIYCVTDFWAADDHGPTQHQTDVYGKLIGPLLSWSEGWADYYSVVSQQMYAPSQLIDSTSNNTNVADFKYRARNIENDNTYLFGESNEWVIARLLYDMDDNGISESWDNISYGGKGLFEKMQDAVPFLSILTTLSMFMDSMYDIGSDDFGSLLSYYYIAANPTMPINNIIATYFAPRFEWDAGGGDPSVTTIEHYNNDFFIHIDAPNGVQLFSHHVESDTYYQMTVDEWNEILTAGYDYIEWYVVAKETTFPTTGPYTSETSKVNMPEATRLNLGIGINDAVGYDDFEWYKFTASETGYYTFYTTGYSDTYGEFFVMPAANYTIENRFAYDNNSGEGSNFSKKLLLYSGETIYIRVRGGLYYYAASYTLNSTFTPRC